MKDYDLRKAFIKKDFTIKEVMEKISEAIKAGLPGGIALAVDEKERLIGVVTDGDIRRALLSNYKMEDKVEEILIKDPIVFKEEQSFKEIIAEIPKKVREKKRYRGKGIIEKIIITNKEGKVVNLLDFYDLWLMQNMVHKRVSVIGLGFVGLTLSLVMADEGFEVLGVEKDEGIVQKLQSKKPPFYEPGLESLLDYHLGNNFKILREVLSDCEVYIIAVGTPLKNDKSPDLTALKGAVTEVGQKLKIGDLVILRSTVPVGTTRGVVLPILEEESGLKVGRDFYLAFAPERTVEGKALYELRTLPQVIGGYDKNSLDLSLNLFKEFTPNVVAVDLLEEAEFVKLLNNTFRDTIFSFSNEFSLVCEKFNLNATKILMAANEGYPRDKIPVPSPGVGGYCLSKDPYFYLNACKEANLTTPLAELGRKINEKIPNFIFEKIKNKLIDLGKELKNSKIFIIGFAFKGEPETSDIRESPTLDLLKLFKEKTDNIYGYDPLVDAEEIRKLGVEFCNLNEGFKGADLVVIMNNHKSYQNIDIYKSLSQMNHPAIFCDYWCIFSLKAIKKIEGITYIGPGITL